MTRIRTVNLIWERRLRGAYPASRYALNEEGTLALAVPRPLEARTYDLTHLRLDGGVEVRTGFAVETLVKLEATPQAENLIGMTSDDIYVFRTGSKSRFLGERRVSFVDAALSPDGQHLAAAFSDMSGESYAVAYGEIGGRVLWTEDVDAALTAAAISPDGGRIAFGGENGTLWLIDSARRSLWEFVQEEPVRALACSLEGEFTAYGTAEGTIGLIDADGLRRWEVRLSGEIAALALTAAGNLCVALVHAESGTHLTCLTGPGQVGWEYDAEKRLTGLALSPEGRYLAVSARDGTLAVYEIVPGEGDVVIGARDTLFDARAQAAELAEAGDLESAYRTLTAALEAKPTDVGLCEDLIARREEWLRTRFAEATSQFESGDFAAAAATLEAMQRLELPGADAVALLEKARLERGKQLLAEARDYETAGDLEAADRALRDAVAGAPFLLEARRDLGALRARQAAETDAEAERLLADGDLEAGVAALERAQAMAPTPERAARLVRAQTAREYAAGMASYSEKRYREAIFQFKKVLARDPDHAEAKRYLGYAQKFVQDSTGDSTSDRFQFLE